jgi:PAS domain-containing protein
VTSPEISDQPPAAIALVGGDGMLKRATALFLDCCADAEGFVAAHQTEIERVLAADAESSAVMLLDAGAVNVSAVIAPDGERNALLTIARPAPEASGDDATRLLDESIDASPAIIWLKDLNGRYLRVNDRFVEALETNADQVCGKTDDELAPGASIEGMRLRSGVAPRREPLEFEYTIGPADDRPAFAVLRFALRNADGEPTIVCGVAAPLARADLARSECARLMRFERWCRSDESAVRAELLDEWGLTPTSRSTFAQGPAAAVSESPISAHQPADVAGDQFAAIAAELDGALATSARLDRELTEERRQATALRETSILAARRAQELLRNLNDERARSAELEGSLARAEARLTEVASERDSERATAERTEAGAADALAQAEQSAETLRLELTAARAELERLEIAVSEAPTLEELEAERAQTHDARLAAEQAQAELATTAASLARERRTVETLRAEVRAAEEEAGRARRTASEAAAQAPTHEELEEERRRADRANSALAGVRARAELAEAEAKSALAQARSELRRAHADVAASSSALHTEQQSVVSLRAELAAVRGELELAVQAAAEKPSPDELEQQRSRAEHAEAANEQIIETLRAELARVREQLERARHAPVGGESQGPALEELDRERRRADQAEAALNEQRVRADQAILVAERAAADAAAALADSEDHRRTAEALRAELTGRPEIEPVGEANATSADESVSESHVWDAASQRALSAALTDVSDWRTALMQAVNVLGSAGAWDAIVAWCPEERRKSMKCIAAWIGEPAERSTFETRTWQHRRKLPANEPGGAADPLSASWLVDLESADDALMRAAAAEGMGSAVLVPISDGEGTIGMLELLSRRAAPPESELLLSLEGVALQLGAIARLLKLTAAPQWRVGRL